MRKLIFALAVAAFALSAQAANDKKPTAQQGKMATCNKDAGDKKGDERKAFMKECLSAKPAAAPGSACDKQAAEKKLAGAAKNSFVKKCKADAASAPKA